MQFLKQRQFFWGAQKLYTKCCTVCNWFIHSFIHSSTISNSSKDPKQQTYAELQLVVQTRRASSDIAVQCGLLTITVEYTTVQYRYESYWSYLLQDRVPLIQMYRSVTTRNFSRINKKRHCTLQNMEGQSPWDPDIETQHTVKLVRTRFPRILQHIRYYHLFFGHIHDWIFMRVPCAKA